MAAIERKLERPVLVAIDMHRGHLDPAVATMPVAAERARAVVERSARIFDRARAAGIPVVHVVTVYRGSSEAESNPFWASKRSGTRARSAEHNLEHSPGTQIIPALYRPGDAVVNTKKRYSAFLHTDLEFVLRDYGARTVLLAGINTNSCVLCNAFEIVNRDLELVLLEECVETMDGPEAHAMALKLMQICLGRVMRWEEVAAELTPIPHG
ncbi:cysteine hydrolase [bacterium]|nr:MAG: cysteine hydrolase [bacterium]